MKTKFIAYIAVSIFAIFIGSQITEGVLLVPYWKSLSAEEFYNYYTEFGPRIGQFYTILTITAALLPLILLIYCWLTKSKALKYALISTIFAVLVIVCFYVYFKGTNAQFYDRAFSAEELQQELITWGYWHWSRIVIECFSLLFMILSIRSLKIVL